MRYSLKTLLAALALVAASCAGLIIATPFWAAAFFTGALILVLSGVVAALVRRGAARAYWTGFAIVAGGYSVVVYLDGDKPFRPDALQYREPQLITTLALIKANSYVEPIRPRVAASQAYYKFGGRVYMNTNPGLNFAQVGHSLFTLLFGLLGGWLGSWFYRRDMTLEAGNP